MFLTGFCFGNRTISTALLAAPRSWQRLLRGCCSGSCFYVPCRVCPGVMGFAQGVVLLLNTNIGPSFAETALLGVLFRCGCGSPNVAVPGTGCGSFSSSLSHQPNARGHLQHSPELQRIASNVPKCSSHCNIPQFCNTPVWPSKPRYRIELRPHIRMVECSA